LPAKIFRFEDRTEDITRCPNSILHPAESVGGSSRTRGDPVFYTLPVSFIRTHHRPSDAWPSVRLRYVDPKELEKYKGDCEFELIAKALKVPYPAKPAREDH